MKPTTEFAKLDLSKTYSYADYLTWQFPEFGPQYVEIVDGQVLPQLPGRSPQHQRCLMSILFSVHDFLRGRPEEMMQIPFDVCPTYQRGQTDADIHTVVQPDLIVMCRPADTLRERGCFGAPDWVVEVLSAGFTARDTQLKFKLYVRSGVREYWLVYPGLNTVVAWTLDAAGTYQLAAEYTEPGPMPVATLPGLALEWAAVFAGQ